MNHAKKKREEGPKLFVDEAIPERRNRTKLMASHFNCKKVTVSLIPMRQYSRSRIKMNRQRTSMITV